MGSIHVHEFVGANGVNDAPAWSFDYEILPGVLAESGAVTDRCEGILLERKTYEEFEEPWSTRTDGDPETAFFNDTPEYVVSSTLAGPTWRNSEAIGPDDPQRLHRLKDEVGDLYVAGSGPLVRGDARRWTRRRAAPSRASPDPWGGPRVFAEGADPLTMKLVGSAAFEHGVVYLNYYRPAVRSASGA